MNPIYTETVCTGNTGLAIPLHFMTGQDIPMGYLDQLAVLRKQRGLTQAALAEKVGVEQPTIQRWEKGKREPELSQLFALAAALGVEPSALIDPSLAAPIGPRLFVKGEAAAGKLLSSDPAAYSKASQACFDQRFNNEFRWRAGWPYWREATLGVGMMCIVLYLFAYATVATVRWVWRGRSVKKNTETA